jgi:signal transduction histidine kinase
MFYLRNLKASHILQHGVRRSYKKYKSLVSISRIVVFDADRHDRALLGLALKSLRPDIDVLEAATALEVVHHISAGPVAALVAEPGTAFNELCAIIDDVRHREPQCQFWLFTSRDEAPSLRDCIARGVDGRAEKTSAGYLSLPGRLFERLRAGAELIDRLALEAGAVLSSVFPLAACLVGRHGNLVAVNREFEELLQRPRYELIDQPLDLLVNEPDRQEDIRRRLHGIREKWELAAPLRTGPGRQQTVAFTARPVGDSAGLVGYWAINLMDVTRLLGASEQGYDKQRESELDRLLFAVSHDLQAPLNSLNSNARFLVEHLQGSDQETTGAVQEVAALTERMQLMLDGILELSTLRSGVREPEVVNLDGVLADAVANLRSDIDDSGATIERQPLPTLRVNRQQMVQVFQNLLANALKFRSSTRVPRVLVSSQETGDSLRILVEDNGIGIEAKDTTRIFSMFQRLHGEREYPGLGIGLALCQQIVRGHGGELFVESTPGRGSCFIIEFRGPGLRSVITRSNRNGTSA